VVSMNMAPVQQKSLNSTILAMFTNHLWSAIFVGMVVFMKVSKVPLERNGAESTH